MKEETIEGNKLIAQFMGWKIAGTRFEKIEFYGENKQNERGASIKHVYYNTSWDWLMPVVEKIHDTGGTDVTIYYQNCKIDFSDEDDGYEASIQGETKIEAVWLAVVDFIKWYNEHK